MMTAATPFRNLMVYFGDVRAAKKPERLLAVVVDGNDQAETLPDAPARFAFIRIAGRICYLRQTA